MTTLINGKASWEKYDELKTGLEKKMPKSWLWLGFVFIGLPALVVGVGIWSRQSANALRYAEKVTVTQCEIRIDRLEASDQYLRRDLDEIKTSLEEVLTLLRKEWRRDQS